MSQGDKDIDRFILDWGARMWVGRWPWFAAEPQMDSTLKCSGCRVTGFYKITVGTLSGGVKHFVKYFLISDIGFVPGY